ncbi:MAG: DEAD/DEAH box helicase, partial [Rhodanobacter sp.]
MNETEADTRANRIDPVLRDAGWGVVEGSKVNREMICPGRITGGGGRANPLSADYVLSYRDRKLAVIEAKRAGLGHTAGVGQAKDYATRLQARFAYASNGIGWYGIDMQTGTEGDIALPFPTPQELWARCFPEGNDWRDRFGAVPFETGGGKWQPRYYQHNAITAVLEAIAKGEQRILLTLATGTGKTSIAFQIAWKLFESSWNLSRDPVRHPRILFLADRNILADQAYNAFSAFAPDALCRISPDEIRKQGRIPKNASVFFTIFQTFMTGTDNEGEPQFTFEGYPADFFDFIVIDECHRGGAKDESAWRGILEYFAPAVQLGMTATPKRDANTDTYRYFGDPVYTYALKEGIGDGFLTPFKVRQMASTLDSYTYSDEDEVIGGEIDPDKEYTEADFNTKIVIDAREESRVHEFMDQIDQRQKSLVFCATQDHAARVRNAINQIKDNPDPHYCERVTADDGKLGEQHLREFQDNEKTLPTILTTSKKLSTGVDARNVRNIVLLRPIKSMIEFKQIIGRGTRTFDGKDFFTIYDFVKGYEHFNDPEWDGEPLPPDEPRRPKDSGSTDEVPPQPGEVKETPEPVAKIVVKLADGKERSIRYLAATTYWHEGRQITAQ